MKKLLLILISVALTSCGGLVQEMASSQFGVIFSRLPSFLGGGISNKIVPPGQYVFLWPWDRLYRFDTSFKYISWGGGGLRTPDPEDDYVYTRAIDGNEVALGVTVQYRVSTDPDKLVRLLKYVAIDEAAVNEIVTSVARAHIRTAMNELKTSSFFNQSLRYEAIEKAHTNMNARLNPDGIIVEKVILDEHRFERLLSDGTTDRSYQERIDETQKLGQDRERELLRIDTVRAQKSQELNETQAKVNRQVAEAEGYLQQAKLRGDGNFESKKNEAEGILAKGTAEAEGLAQQISALSGSGGKAILKLELARQLLKQNPKFVLMTEGGGAGALDVRRIDTNELLKQAQVFEALRDEQPKTPTSATPPQ